MSNQAKNPATEVQKDRNEDAIPDIDLLSLAEERAASAPITDFGVFQGLTTVYV